MFGFALVSATSNNRKHLKSPDTCQKYDLIQNVRLSEYTLLNYRELHRQTSLKKQKAKNFRSKP